MCFRSATRTIVATALLGAMLGGCSEYYFDRRDTITLYSGDAMATNRVTQMIDPWPVASGNRNIAYSGDRMQGAAERYRSHRIIQPVSPITSLTGQPPSPPALTTEAVPAQNASSTPAAPVK